MKLPTPFRIYETDADLVQGRFCGSFVSLDLAMSYAFKWFVDEEQKVDYMVLNGTEYLGAIFSARSMYLRGECMG